MQLRVKDHVFCPRLGTEEFEIVEVKDSTREFVVKSLKTNERSTIYQVHCHASPRQLVTRRRELQVGKIQFAKQIGQPHPNAPKRRK